MQPPMTTAPHARYVYDFDEPPRCSAEERLRLLGGKGAHLVLMATDLGLPVPPGFVVTTEACRTFLAGSWPQTLDDELRGAMDRLGASVGRRFGDETDPLLVSVRSGAPVSMPGMMDTILDLGLTAPALTGLARQSGSTEFAQDCLRRLRAGWQSVIGTDELPEDPWVQLRSAIEAVFRSWNSERARAYRQREGIADDLGTAVTVQAMVFGNRGLSSGTGVLFTRNPATGENEWFGDVLFNAQGEDVVAGTHATSPIGELATSLPVVAKELRDYSEVLERHMRDVADIEFTIEDGRLWMLQVRAGKKSPRAALRIAAEMALDDAFPLSKSEAVERVMPLIADPPRVFVRASNVQLPIARGLPASPGVAVGAVVTTSDAAVEARDRGERVILVRDETSPEDVRGMASAVGVLTSRGGLASHAAVVARGWGIPAVVGAGDLSVGEGEIISIDGSTGEIFRDELAGSWEVAPEAGTLLEWARELGIAVVTRAGIKEFEPSDAFESPLQIRADDVVRTLAVRGSITPGQLEESTLGDSSMLDPLVDELIASGSVEKAAGALRLTASGKLAATELFSADRFVVGDERARELLDEFHELDARMKALVTAWQVRDVGGEQVVNDHADAEYDGQIIEQLNALDTDTGAWLAPIALDLGRFGTYRTRLGHALELARAGDQRFVASPRVDSYHSVWFELHEDLIRVSGKKRAEATSG